MAILRTGKITWQTGRPVLRLLPRARRSVLAVWGRTLAVAAAAAALAFTTAGPAPRAADQTRAAALRPAAESEKGQDRLASWPGRSTTPKAEAVRTDAHRPASVFDPHTMLPGARLSGGLQSAATDRFVPAPAAEWVEREFSRMAVVDGRTLQSDGLSIRLVGLDLPLPEQMCRTLDGRFEPCVTRAATQLELLTRWRPVTCHYRLDRPGEAIGRCRIGLSDLAQRMVQTGFAWQSAAPSSRPRI
ncbi:MAG TPA: hypothetical protein VIL09_08655 [Microvirga sp.]|jgi:endonuclease YncB( thermonuclease family)